MTSGSEPLAGSHGKPSPTKEDSTMAIPTEKPSYGPLDGVKVVYAAVELACPKAADLMADWGADVVWLENTGAGDTIRDTAYVKQAERRNQRSVALNYFSEEGKKVFFDLVKDADIFMEASKGGTWARKGITDDVLWELNPKMVIVHVSGFGQEGDPKMVKRAAYDLTVMAYSGIIMQNGTEEQPMLPGPYADDRLLGAGGSVQGREVRQGREHRPGHVRDASGHRPVLPGRLP